MSYVELDGWRTIPQDICLKSAKKQGNGKIEEYQNWELQTAISHCAKLRIAVDIGAHVGITSFRLSQSFEHVHAYEVNTKLLPNEIAANSAVPNCPTIILSMNCRKV